VSGRFITLEGIDGAGKSTHIENLAAYLKRHGTEVVCTREPGGTALAEQLRVLVLHSAMDAMTEALLVFAARRDHLKGLIESALARGATVLCDRFSDATFAYQGAGRGFDLEVLRQLEQWVQGGVRPDMTLWFDLDPAVAVARLADARRADRFEVQGTAFFERVRGGYLQRMQSDPTRFVRIDAGADRDRVWAEILSALEARAW
jgi:dTMP kinase